MREGWVNINMVDACDLITCGVAARPKYVDDGIPFLSAKNVKEGKILFRDYNCITLENHQELTKKNKPLIGDLLYTRVGSYGEAAVIEEDVEFSVFVSLTLIKPKRSLLNSYFLKYYLNSHEVKTLAKKSITSSGVGNLNVGTVRKFPVKIPPLEEQKEIVSILDDAFASIDKAKANIERNIENAKELFQSKLNEIFSQTDESFTINRFDELTLDLLQGINTATDKTKFCQKGVPILQAKEIGSEKLNMNKCKYISKDDFKIVKDRYKAKTGDILLNNIGSSLGRCIVVSWDFDFTFAWNVMRVIPKRELILPDYLKFAIQSPQFQKNIWGQTRGVGMPFISKKNISKITISYPNLNTQKKDINFLKKLNILTKSSISNYEKELENLEKLKKSILQKAFSGELTNKSVAA